MCLRCYGLWDCLVLERFIAYVAELVLVDDKDYVLDVSRGVGLSPRKDQTLEPG